MVRIFFLPYLGNRSKSDPCSCELLWLESHILSFPKVLQIPPESPCMYRQYRQFNIRQFYVLPTQCIYVFRKAIRTNSDYFPEQVLQRAEGSNILHTMKRRKANWIGHIFRRNCLLKQVIEGKQKAEQK